MTSVFRTAHPAFSIEYSPYDDRRVVVGTGQYFGIVGNGRLQFLVSDEKGFSELRSFESPVGIFDCAWNECNPNQVVSAGASGAVKLWDITVRDSYPVASFSGHDADVASVDWNLTTKDCFVTGGWDSTVWQPGRQEPVSRFTGHSKTVYCVQWSPHKPHLAASASGDCSFQLLDCASGTVALSMPAHPTEVLALDWNKYNSNVIATAGLDRIIKFWDIRRPIGHFAALAGHKMGIRRLKFSPHAEHVLASVGYDMCVMVWDKSREDSLLQCGKHHTEFVTGIDFRLFRPGRLASCGWDCNVFEWELARGPPRIS